MTTPDAGRRAARLICLVAVMACPHRAMAQTAPAAPAADTQLSFDRPEAWAMKYFTSATFLSGLETPNDLVPGSVAVGFESAWLPPLSEAQERVGFNGRAPEDLNKAPVFLRPRVAVGLPGRLAVIAAIVPPIRSFDVTARLAALAVDWAMLDRGEWSVGWRAHGQLGTVAAAVTCPSSVVAFAPGSADNPRGCNAESSDVTTLRYGGVELHASRRISEALAPHVAIGVNVIDSVFQTNALTFGTFDRSRMTARGVTFSASAGIGYVIGERFAIAADAFYTPLTVRRTSADPSSIDPLVNARVLVTYRVRR